MQCLHLKGWVKRRLNGLRDNIFLPIVSFSLRIPYFIIACAVSVILVTSSLMSGGHIRFIFFPTVEGDEIKVSLEMPAGASFASTESAMNQIVEGSDTAIGSQHPEMFRFLSVTIGGRLSSGFGANGNELGAEKAEATLELAPADMRTLSSAQIERYWRDAVGQIPGVSSLTFESSGLSGGADLSFNLSHQDEDILLKAARELVIKMESIPSVSEIESTAQPGKRQIEFTLTEAGVAAGLAMDDLARRVRRAYFGEEAMRLQRVNYYCHYLYRIVANDY